MSKEATKIDQVAQDYLARSLAEGGGLYAVAWAILQLCRQHAGQAAQIGAKIDEVGEAVNRLADNLA